MSAAATGSASACGLPYVASARAPCCTGDELSFGQSHFVYLLSGELHARLLKGS
ncbi:MAG: hypothetical protein JNK82_35815 [Myxococcaceae bacterium]|nr:hypothetical protein [Myxococcaceae bacterium]